MANYLAMRIIQEKLNYTQVTTLYPQFKDEIDAILIQENREDLIA